MFVLSSKSGEGLDSRRTLLRFCLPDGYFAGAEVDTMSDLVLSTMAINSFCSAAGTWNFARLARKSTSNACHSFSVMWKSLWAVFMSRPAYLQGPPVTEQTRVETCQRGIDEDPVDEIVDDCGDGVEPAQSIVEGFGTRLLLSRHRHGAGGESSRFILLSNFAS